MFGLTGQEKISYILSAGWFLTESLFANEKCFRSQSVIPLR